MPRPHWLTARSEEEEEEKENKLAPVAYPVNYIAKYKAFDSLAAPPYIIAPAWNGGDKFQWYFGNKANGHRAPEPLPELG